MDTVEWGSGRSAAHVTRLPGAVPVGLEPFRPAESARTGRSLARLGGRWTVLVLAALGLVAMVASEFLPWVSIHVATSSSIGIDSSSSPTDAGEMSLDLDRLSTTATFAYQLGLLAVGALVGAVLFGRSGQGRGVFGFAVGVILAEGLSLAGLIHSFAHLLDNGVLTGRAGLQSTLQPGTYLAAAGLLLLLAATVLSAAPERVRARLADAVHEPADAQFTDEPIELTVTQAKPLDEAHFARPDPRRR